MKKDFKLYFCHIIESEIQIFKGPSSNNNKYIFSVILIRKIIFVYHQFALVGKLKCAQHIKRSPEQSPQTFPLQSNLTGDSKIVQF